jgi:hypothetical protein
LSVPTAFFFSADAAAAAGVGFDGGSAVSVVEVLLTVFFCERVHHIHGGGGEKSMRNARIRERDKEADGRTVRL